MRINPRISCLHEGLEIKCLLVHFTKINACLDDHSQEIADTYDKGEYGSLHTSYTIEFIKA